MALPNTGITTNIIGTALGTSSRNVGALCSSSLVNPYSRYKPVKWYQKDTTAGITNWEKSNTGSYGLSVRTCSLASPTDLSNTSYAWSYDRPSGGRDYPYRMGDFRGYEHTAPVAFSSSLPDTLSYSDTTILKTAVGAGGTYNIGLYDILGELQIYAGVKVQASDGSYYWYSTLAVGARPLMLDFNAPPFYQNNKFLSNIDVSLFLCNYYQTSWASSYPTSGFKCWQPITTISKHYDRLQGNPAGLPSANIQMGSISPTKVTWDKSDSVSIVVTVTTKDGLIPKSGIQIKVTSYLNYTSSLYYEYSANPSKSNEVGWKDNGNGTFSSTPITVYDTLILNSSGNPIKGTTPRSASLQFWEKMVISTKTYYTTFGGTNTEGITLMKQ